MTDSVAGAVAGILARGRWKGALTAVLAVAAGYAWMMREDYRVVQGPQLEQLSAWGSFVEAFLSGG